MAEPDSDPGAVRRCGYVALIGAPNAGKSTLINALVGPKVAIVTPKAQTTRTRVRGIAVGGRSQIVFVDTPGIFAAAAAARSGHGRGGLVGCAAMPNVGAADRRRARPRRGYRPLLERLAERGRMILSLNKIDLVRGKPTARVLPIGSAERAFRPRSS